MFLMEKTNKNSKSGKPAHFVKNFNLLEKEDICQGTSNVITIMIIIIH